MSWEQIGVICGAGLAGLTLAGLVVRSLVTASRSARRFFALVDRVAGVPAQGTRAAVPGALDRLDTVADGVSDVRAQIYPNGGGSLRDAVDMTRTQLEQLDRRFTDHLLVWHAHGAPETPGEPLDK